MSDEPKDDPTVHYGVFRVSDDRLVKRGVCQESMIEAQARNGQYARQGRFEVERDQIRYAARELRRRAYPTTGDQLGAIVDLAKAVKAAGIAVPASVDAWIEQIEAVKAAHAKD